MAGMLNIDLNSIDPRFLAQLYGGQGAPQQDAAQPAASGQAPDANAAPAQSPQQPQGMLASFTPEQAQAMIARARPGVLGTLLGAFGRSGSFDQVRDDITERNLARMVQPVTFAAKTNAGIEQAQIQALARRRALDRLMGGNGAQGGTSSAGAAGAPSGQAPAQAQGAPVIDRDTAAAMALGGDESGLKAYAPYAPKYATDRTSGQMYDETNGTFNGQQADRAEYVNDQLVHPFAKNAPKFVGKPPVEGAEPLYDQSGNVRAWHMADGSVQAIQQAKEAGAEGEAMGSFHDVPLADGRTMPMLGRQIVSGSSAQGAPPAPAASAAPGAPGGMGFGQSTADKAFQAEDGKNVANTVLHDVSSRDAAVQEAADAAQGLTFVKTHPMNPTTPVQAELSEWARALPPQIQRAAGITGHLANDAATYERLIQANKLAFAKGNLPSRYTERELNLVGKITGGLGTPNEAGGLYWATRGALANRQRDRADFARGYQGERSSQAYENGWQSGPGAKSIFQDPIWQGVTINGKPAVTYATKGGVRYGIFNPYTQDGKPNPNGYVFRVQ